jgi:hypothetical protein
MPNARNIIDDMKKNYTFYVYLPSLYWFNQNVW